MRKYDKQFCEYILKPKDDLRRKILDTWIIGIWTDFVINKSKSL